MANAELGSARKSATRAIFFILGPSHGGLLQARKRAFLWQNLSDCAIIGRTLHTLLMKTKTHIQQNHKIAIAVALLAITYLAAGLTFLGADAATPLYSVSLDGEKELTRGNRTTYTVTVTNNSLRSTDITMEHKITMPDFKNGKVPLVFMGASSNVKCAATSTGAACRLGAIASKKTVSVKLIYTVKECGTALSSIVQAGSNAFTQYRSRELNQIFKSCSPSDRTPPKPTPRKR